MNDKNIQLNIDVEIEKGDACLRQAEILMDNEEFDGAVSRTYYAIFHYVTAMLFKKGLEARSHEALIRLFNLHYIKSSALEKRYSKILSHSQKAREEADYWPEIPFTKEDAKAQLDEAREFIEKMQEMLK